MKMITIKQEKGVTLIELMVAVTIGLILMAGLGSIYLSNKQSFKMNNVITNFQENGRYIASVINRDIHRAGHAGCINVFQRGLEFTSSFNTDAAAFYGSPIQGFEYSTTNNPNPELPTGSDAPDDDVLDPVAISNSDILSIQYAENIMVEIDNMSGNASDIDLKTPLKIDDGDYAVISDCLDANVFIAGATGDGDDDLVGGPANALVKSYQKTGNMWPTVMRFVSRTYYIGSGTSANALYLRDNLTGRTEKLVEGIQTINLLYGVDVSGDMQYMEADDINSADLMDKILMIKIDFTLISTEKVDTGAAQKDYTRRVFSTTVDLRNQG